MGFRINTNESSLQAQRALNSNLRQSEHVLHQMSMGERIVSAADDAAGMAISETLRASLRSIQQADRNANDGISIIQTAEGALNEVSSILIRLRELSVQSASDTLGDKERAFSNQEYQALKEEVDRIVRSTEYNGMKLLSGDTVLEFQIGTNNRSDTDRINFDRSAVSTSLENLKIADVDISSKEGAQDSLDILQRALDNVSSKRASLGATQNRLASTSNNLQIAAENVSAAKSRIRDLDFAEAAADNTRLNILTASGISVLAQANRNPLVATKLIE